MADNFHSLSNKSKSKYTVVSLAGPSNKTRSVQSTLNFKPVSSTTSRKSSATSIRVCSKATKSKIATHFIEGDIDSDSDSDLPSPTSIIKKTPPTKGKKSKFPQKRVNQETSNKRKYEQIETIELTSESKNAGNARSPMKRNKTFHKSSSLEVIDLCSEEEDSIPEKIVRKKQHDAFVTILSTDDEGKVPESSYPTISSSTAVFSEVILKGGDNRYDPAMESDISPNLDALRLTSSSQLIAPVEKVVQSKTNGTDSETQIALNHLIKFDKASGIEESVAYSRNGSVNVFFNGIVNDRESHEDINCISPFSPSVAAPKPRLPTCSDGVILPRLTPLFFSRVMTTFASRKKASIVESPVKCQDTNTTSIDGVVAENYCNQTHSFKSLYSDGYLELSSLSPGSGFQKDIRDLLPPATLERSTTTLRSSPTSTLGESASPITPHYQALKYPVVYTDSDLNVSAVDLSMRDVNLLIDGLKYDNSSEGDVGDVDGLELVYPNEFP